MITEHILTQLSRLMVRGIKKSEPVTGYLVGVYKGEFRACALGCAILGAADKRWLYDHEVLETIDEDESQESITDIFYILDIDRNARIPTGLIPSYPTSVWADLRVMDIEHAITFMNDDLQLPRRRIAAWLRLPIVQEAYDKGANS